MIRKAVVMCGGWATRFLPASKVTPKELLPLYDTPILQIIVDDLVNNGVDEIMFVIRNGKESIAKYFAKDYAFENAVAKNYTLLEKLENYNNAKFYFTYQNFQRGTGDAVYQAKEWVGKDTFFLLNGDEIINNKISIIRQMLDKYNSTHTSVIGLYQIENNDIEKYGIADIRFDKNGLIKRIVEKPKICDAPSNYANLGAYIFEPSIFNYIKKADNMPITDAINLYCQNNYLYGEIIEGERYDLGNPLGYVLSNISYVLQKEDTRNKTIQHLENLGFIYKGKPETNLTASP